MLRQFYSSLSLFVLLAILTGLGYPLLTLNIGQQLFPRQANGSLIVDQEKIIGSELIGQNFSGDAYFHSRPSAAGTGYDAANSSGSNLASTSPQLLKAVTDRVAAVKRADTPKPVPVDLVTASGSGLDPHISPAAAQFQIKRVALARQTDATKIQGLIDQYTEPRSLGFLGESRVNVLLLNRMLDQQTPLPSPLPAP